MFYVALNALQAVNKIVALAGTIPDGIAGFLFIKFLMIPDWKILLQYLQECGLLQCLDLE